MGATGCNRVQHVVEDRLLSNYSFTFGALISHAGVLTVVLSFKCGLQRGVVLSQADISRSGPLESLLTLASQHLTACV